LLAARNASKLAGYNEGEVVRWTRGTGFQPVSEVAEHGLQTRATSAKTNQKRSLAHDPHDRARRLAAKQTLKYPPVRFDEQQRSLIADGFERAIGEGGYVLHALCIGHDHSHAIVARHERTIERIGDI
jgi:hypothetical protein